MSRGIKCIKQPGSRGLAWIRSLCCGMAGVPRTHIPLSRNLPLLDLATFEPVCSVVAALGKRLLTFAGGKDRARRFDDENILDSGGAPAPSRMVLIDGSASGGWHPRREATSDGSSLLAYAARRCWEPEKNAAARAPMLPGGERRSQNISPMTLTPPEIYSP